MSGEYPAYTIDVDHVPGEKYPWRIELRRQEKKYAKRVLLRTVQSKTLPGALKTLGERIEVSRTTPPYTELM